MIIHEYANFDDMTPVASNTLMSNNTNKQDFMNMTDTFTTDASTNYITIEFVLNESTGKISLGEIRIIPDEVEVETQP